jgi:hypothetical protein
LTNIFDFYRDPKKHDDLKAILDLGAQKHPAGLVQNFLEKDIWVAEVLRLLYELRRKIKGCIQKRVFRFSLDT